MLKRSLAAIVMTLVTTLVYGNLAWAALTSTDIQNELICQCGCTMVVAPCDCETANQMRALIASKISEGQNKDQIIGYFVAQYGEKVLAAPTKKGFNLTVWVLPFVAIAAGGIAISFILRTWVWKGKTQTEPAPSQFQSEEVRQAYRKRFQEEFGRFSQEETKK